MNSHQRGITHILLIILAAIGLMIFLLIAQSLPVKDNLFSTLYPKPASHAVTPPVNVPVLSVSYLPTTPCYAPTSKLDLSLASATSNKLNTLPQQAIDGNIDQTKWAPSVPYRGTYLQIDLKAIKTIKALSPYFWSADRPESYHIDVSATGSFTGEQTRVVAETSGLKGYYVYKAGSAIERKDYYFNPVNVRYIRLTIDAYRNNTTSETGQVNMYEFEVFADYQQKNCLNTSITGDVQINSNPTMADPLSTVRARISDFSLRLAQTLQKGSTYHGYKDTTATPYLSYQVLEHKEFLQPIPISQTYTNRPDYRGILNGINICNYVDNLGVKDVWIWSYHTTQVAPEETDMAMGTISKAYWNQTSKFDVYPNASYGDISNSSQTNDLPICNHTYVLYNFVYGPSFDNLVHNYLHQIENELAFANREMFWDMYTGRQYSFSGPRRCGHSHIAPNSTADYGYTSSDYASSDCEDWIPVNCINQPMGTQCGGTRQSINCSKWNCNVLQYYTWWMQNLPGKDNILTYNGQKLRNWWEFMADFDLAIAKGKSLTYLQNIPTSTATPTGIPAPTKTLTPAPLQPPFLLPVTMYDNLSPLSGDLTWTDVREVGSTGYWADISTEPNFANGCPSSTCYNKWVTTDHASGGYVTTNFPGGSPVGFRNLSGANLVMTYNIPYWARVYNGQHSNVREFAFAITPTQTPTPIPPSSLFINGVSATNITATSATISWRTTSQGTTSLEYWAATGKDRTHRFTGSDNLFVTSHIANLYNLDSKTNYSYIIRSKDLSGKEHASPIYKFKTLSR